MNFDDHYRKQSKKTLWGEELDSESLFDKLNKEYVNNLTPSFDLHSSLNHHEGKKYKCTHCGNKYENHETEMYKGNVYCRACVQGLYHYDE
ncbi:hypothetical protein [Bacillus sp. AFS031507]|uniref:hypothetical protein n=1 Tax=Bacillus sp. AFS031507 TaxID=2033496 RepID=UPI000BFD5AC6|nr:hypothetical protein [Bacillus sp. AFS031507]PGY09149.1 hypothetical protein COE25_19010 [Bacillus sp. AFS031507]